VIQVRFSSHHTRPREIHHKDTEDTKVSFGVTRGQRLRRRCKYISPSATAANNAKFTNALKRGEPFQSIFFSPADLRALCGEIPPS
jgi:hypothetical protein